MQGHLGTLEHGSHGDGELLAAGITLIKARTMGLPFQGFDAVSNPAMGAVRAVRPPFGFQILTGLGFIGENGVCQVNPGLTP